MAAEQNAAVVAERKAEARVLVVVRRATSGPLSFAGLADLVQPRKYSVEGAHGVSSSIRRGPGPSCLLARAARKESLRTARRRPMRKYGPHSPRRIAFRAPPRLICRAIPTSSTSMTCGNAARRTVSMCVPPIGLGGNTADAAAMDSRENLGLGDPAPAPQLGMGGHACQDALPGMPDRALWEARVPGKLRWSDELADQVRGALE